MKFFFFVLKNVSIISTSFPIFYGFFHMVSPSLPLLVFSFWSQIQLILMQSSAFCHDSSKILRSWQSTSQVLNIWFARYGKEEVIESFPNCLSKYWPCVATRCRSCIVTSMLKQKKKLSDRLLIAAKQYVVADDLFMSMTPKKKFLLNIRYPEKGLSKIRFAKKNLCKADSLNRRQPIQ